jgi:hypothetical protein
MRLLCVPLTFAFSAFLAMAAAWCRAREAERVEERERERRVASGVAGRECVAVDCSFGADDCQSAVCEKLKGNNEKKRIEVSLCAR